MNDREMQYRKLWAERKRLQARQKLITQELAWLHHEDQREKKKSEEKKRKSATRSIW